MDIILYLLQLIQYQHKQICWLLNFICRYIPLKQWAFDDSCTCPRCDAPKPFLYKNNGSKGQLLCKICDARFSPDESRFSSVKLRCPHCGNTLVPKKDRKHFIVHKCINLKCPYFRCSAFVPFIFIRKYSICVD